MKRKTTKYTKQIIIQDYKEGGLRHRHKDYITFVKTQKIMQVKRLLKIKMKIIVCVISEKYLLIMKFDDVLSSSIAPKNIESYIPHFYKEILHHWYENRKDPSSKMDIQNETVWFNKNVLVDNTAIFYKTLYDKGMNTIKYLMSTQNSFCTALKLKK